MRPRAAGEFEKHAGSVQTRFSWSGVSPDPMPVGPPRTTSTRTGACLHTRQAFDSGSLMGRRVCRVRRFLGVVAPKVRHGEPLALRRSWNGLISSAARITIETIAACVP